MAKVVNPLLSTEARGKFGGNIYNTWHGINYVKAFTAPAQPGSPKQLEARNRLQYLSQQWRDLTEAQRNSWKDYAESHLLPDWTGTPKRLTSQNWFIKCNAQILRIPGTLRNTAPVDPQPDPPTGFTLSYASNAIKATWTAPTSGTLYLDFWYVGPHSAGRVAPIEHARALLLTPGNTTKPVTLIDSPTPGRYTVWARVLASADGLTSTWTSATIDVTE